MYDDFEPLQIYTKTNFSFNTSKYELWIGGKLIDSGNIETLIEAIVINEEGLEKVKVIFSDPILHNELSSENVFDIFISINDRLQLLIIPENTNVNIPAFVAYKLSIGTTRIEKNFARNEPYCCNLFFVKGHLVKVTFSFSNPEKLLEFYS